jgi:putative sigma-54 modulation protein
MTDANKFAEEEALGYNITITGRNIQVTEAMKNYAWDKLTKIERFQTHIMDVHVTLDIHKLEHSAVIVLKFNHFKIKVQAASSDMYASIDKAVDKLQATLRKWKSRIQDHHNKALRVIDMQVNVLQRPYDELAEFNADIESQNRQQDAAKYTVPKVIGQETLPLKTLSDEEAVMKMELSGDHFLVFRGERDQKIRVIYRRSDENYGIIQPE